MLRKTSAWGFSLIEVVMAIGILGGITVTLTLVIRMALVSASDTQLEETSQLAAHQTLSEVRQVVRSAVAVHQAGSNLLVVSTRHYYDSEDDVERIRLSLSGNDLLREISQDDGLTYGQPEVLNDKIVSFNATAFRVEDSFDAADYDSGVDAIPVGKPTAVDTSQVVKYRVRDLGRVDSSVSDSVGDGQLEIESSSLLGEYATVAPQIAKEDLSLGVLFTPTASGGAFTPLLFGSVLTGVSVHFSAFGSIQVISNRNGFPLAMESATNNWVAGTTYSVQLRFQGDIASATVATARGVEQIVTDVPTASDLTSGEVNLVSFTPSRSGIWDDLTIGYDRVTIELGVDVGGAVDVLVSKVAPQSW